MWFSGSKIVKGSVGLGVHKPFPMPTRPWNCDWVMSYDQISSFLPSLTRKVGNQINFRRCGNPRKSRTCWTISFYFFFKKKELLTTKVSGWVREKCLYFRAIYYALKTVNIKVMRERIKYIFFWQTNLLKLYRRFVKYGLHMPLREPSCRLQKYSHLAGYINLCIFQDIFTFFYQLCCASRIRKRTWCF